jgi:hypothetical protein
VPDEQPPKVMRDHPDLDRHGVAGADLPDHYLDRVMAGADLPDHYLDRVMHQRAIEYLLAAASDPATPIGWPPTSTTATDGDSAPEKEPSYLTGVLTARVSAYLDSITTASPAGLDDSRGD